MNKFRQLLTKARSEEGMSLVEVVVAMLVFAIISVGVAYSTVAVSKITEDTSARQVATNLATAEVDYARGLQDPFAITNASRTIKVGTVNYYLVRTVEWVDANGTDVGCGTGTGVMQAKRINITVKWDGMLTTTSDVRVDTLLSPDERINDPSLGTIRISVLGVAGTGTTGVGVTIAPTSGGAALQEQPAVTNSDGCSFALKVAPGTYSVTINRAGSVDTNQVTSPSKSVVVTAGGSIAALFQYDYAATFNVQYASNAAAGATPVLPTNLDTTYLSTYGAHVDSSGPKTSVSLHPFTSGYAGIAGKYIAPIPGGNQGCINVDPASWPEGTVSNKLMAAGVRSPNVAALPKGSANMPVPMGLMTVKSSSTAFLFAVSVAGPSGSGDPGCAAAPTYSFGQVLKNGTINIALPYGSWVLYSSSTANGLRTPVPAANLGLVGSLLSILGGGTTVTLDPRQPK